MTYAKTDKDALQYESSGSRLVDFFSKAAVQRMQVLAGEDDLIPLYKRAKQEDHILATKTVFWLRDPRAGAGERAAGIKLLKHLADTQPGFVSENMLQIAEYGRWKDLIELSSTHKNDVIITWAKAIKEGDRLASKWAPRKGDLARSIRDELGITNAEYRHTLKKNSETVEQAMCSKDWGSIDYTKVPSVAMRKYSRAFRKNDTQRFDDFLGDSTKKINTAVNYPHEVVRHIRTDVDVSDKMWTNLPEFTQPGQYFLTVVDVSGSMTCTAIDKAGSQPIHVALALGLYLAERNVGPFANKVITFSDMPQWVEIDPKEKLHQKFVDLCNIDWGGTTNIERTYELILKLANAASVPQDKMPSTLIILSDMQFDSCTSGMTHLDNIQNKYKEYGYEIPKLVFWNLSGSYTGSPIDNRDNVALISGFSPTILKAVLQNKVIDPVGVLKDAVDGYNINFDHFDPEA
jgi:hypothetical protein